MFVSETKSWSPLFDGSVTGKCGYNFNRLYGKKKYDCAPLNSGMDRQNLATDVRKATNDKLLTCTEVNSVTW